MAVDRVLKDSEKQQLQSNQDYRDFCVWSLKDFAKYWANDDPAFISARIAELGDYKRWAKNWVWANQHLVNLQWADNSAGIGNEFAILLGAMLLWDTAVTPFNVATVIAYMDTQGKFDELAILYVNAKTPTAVF